MQEKKITKILFIKLSSLGDIVLSTPALKTIAKNYPTAKITYLVEKEGFPLIKDNPYVASVIVFDRTLKQRNSLLYPFAFIKEVIKTIKKLRAVKFDLVFDFQGLFKSWIFLILTKSKFKVGKGRFLGVDLKSPHRRKTTRHAIDSYFEMVDLLGMKRLKGKENKPELHFKDINIKKVNKLIRTSKNIAVLSPFTKWKTKEWVLENWIEVGTELEKSGYTVVISGSNSDNKKAERIAKSISTEAVVSAGQLNLNEFSYLLSIAQILVTVDSLTMHIASCFNVKGIALFGSTDPERTGPFGKNIEVIQGDCRNIACLRKRCFKKQSCMKTISTDDVVKKIKKIMIN